MKLHHAITDGVGGMKLQLELLDLDPDAPERDMPERPAVHVMGQRERFTDAVIRQANEQTTRVVFALWGRPAQEKMKLIDATRHAVIHAAHPSPLSAHRGFFGSKPFSSINRTLGRFGHPEIDWCLPSGEATRGKR